MRAAHRYESFYGNAYHQVYACTQGYPATLYGQHCSITGSLPVERIVNIREYMKEMYGVEITKTIADSVHYGKQQMKAENGKLKGAMELELSYKESAGMTSIHTV